MIKIRIKATAFTATGSPLKGVPTNRAKIPVGDNMTVGGSHVGVRASSKRDGIPSTFLLITAEGIEISNDIFTNLSVESYKNGLASLMEKGLVEVLLDGAAQTVTQMYAL